MANTQNLATLSDGLAAMIRAIEPTRNTGLVMQRRDVATFLDGMQAMLDAARHLETIADRAQWNDKARRARLAAAVADGSVSILPVAARPTAIHQGEGGAA